MNNPLQITDFLKKYDFIVEQKQFIIDDFSRPSPPRRKQTTKQLLVNRKHSFHKSIRSQYMSDLYEFVPKSTFNSWKIEPKLVTSNDYLNHKTKKYKYRFSVTGNLQ